MLYSLSCPLLHKFIQGREKGDEAMSKKIWIISHKHLKIGILTVIACCILLFSLLVSPSFLTVFSSKEEPRAFYRADIEEKKVALTFNISWGEERALPIVDILRDKEVEATFFISGAWAERHPEIVEKIVENGHTLGNHGFQHKKYTNMEEEEIIRDLHLSHKKIKDVTEQDVTYFRPPFGELNKEVLSIVERFGYSTIHWSVEGNDWNNPGKEQIITSITEKIQPGDVILLHASDSAKQTGDSLPSLIDRIREKGYEFVSLEELITQAETEVKEIK